MLQVVWFKRDLRLYDHRPLTEALARGPVICLYVIEDEYWALADTSQRQWDFIRECLQDLHLELQFRQGTLSVARGDVVQILDRIYAECGRFCLHSHEETGNLWTYERDKAVAQWCRQHDTVWREHAQMGVRRAGNDRDTWASHWQKWMSHPCLGAPEHIPAFSAPGSLPPSQWPQQMHPHNRLPCPGRQPGGRRQGLDILQSFLNTRGEFYRGSISSPLTAEDGCSRLSPYLATGCIGMRELVTCLRQARARSRSVRWNTSLSAFESRLWWHCHFIQKLEDEPEMEIQNLHPATNQLDREYDPYMMTAWQEGKTGWPMVDACMRYLIHHGWVNFRMRAMLVSVATYPLWQPWQPVAHWLASLFTDYEPGIHYPQIQMQAGTTGINIPRIYNPTLQAQRLDPEGHFIRRWVPELRSVSNHWIHQPWLMSQRQQREAQVVIGDDYPMPLVDFSQASRQAKARLTAIRDDNFRQQANDIGEKHGSRKRGSRKAGPRMKQENKKAREAGQMSLF
ncbi:MAG: deoxyribodipyrimidine photolyase [Thalassolituus sp.]|nr:MAG: deoxyribodipyrimidine photolyase [Thalassolituus sp.]